MHGRKQRQEGVGTFVKTLSLFFAILLFGRFVGAVPLASALEVGDKAPDFKLPATTGSDISLGDFKGKKFVLLEFYGAAFVPT